VNVSTILSPIVVNDARAKQFFTTYQSPLLLYLFSPGPLPFESSKRMPGYFGIRFQRSSEVNEVYYRDILSYFGYVKKFV